MKMTKYSITTQVLIVIAHDTNGFVGGINDLQAELSRILDSTSDDDVKSALFVAADALVKDINKLPKPRSQISKSGYTHLVDSVLAWYYKTSQVKVGWGKFYGPILEHGSGKMAAQPHLKPTWEKNKIKYQEDMINYLKLN